MEARDVVDDNDQRVADTRSLGKRRPEIILIRPAREVERKHIGMIGQMKGELGCVLVAVGGYENMGHRTGNIGHRTRTTRVINGAGKVRPAGSSGGGIAARRY